MNEDKRMTVHVDVPVEDLGKLDTMAIDKDDGTSRSELIRIAIKEYIAKNKK